MRARLEQLVLPLIVAGLFLLIWHGAVRLSGNSIFPTPFRVASFDEQLRGGARRWQELTQLFYDVAPIFAWVVADSEHRQQLLRLCEGEVYDSSAEQALALLRESFDEIRESPDHPFHKSLVEASV